MSSFWRNFHHWVHFWWSRWWKFHQNDDIFILVNAHALLWHHYGHDGISNHQPHDCLLDRLSRCRSKETSKLRVTGLCEGNSQVTGEFPAQRASNAENVSIWQRHHVLNCIYPYPSGLLHKHWGKHVIGSLPEPIISLSQCQWGNPEIHG